MIEVYKRNCPKCGDVIEYKNPRSFKWADRDKKPCRKCYSKQISATLKKQVEEGTYVINRRPKNDKVTYTHFRNCPECGNEIGYSRVDIYKRSVKDGTLCNACSSVIHKKGVMKGLTIEQTQKMRATKAGFGSWDEYVEKYPKKQFYKREVWRLTYKHPLNELEHWEKRGRCGVEGAYQLDHIRSINWGWENGIPAEEIAEWDNLRMIPWKENREKW
jgi:RNA polymerase-binding transcription factor DksA